MGEALVLKTQRPMRRSRKRAREVSKRCLFFGETTFDKASLCGRKIRLQNFTIPFDIGLMREHEDVPDIGTHRYFSLTAAAHRILCRYFIPLNGAERPNDYKSPGAAGRLSFT